MEDQLRILVGLGLTLLLVMLRVEANLFGTAEYDEPIAEPEKEAGPGIRVDDDGPDDQEQGHQVPRQPRRE